MTGPANIVIVGAGLAGLATAALLATRARSSEFAVTVIDAAPRPEFDADADIGMRVSAISAGSVAILDEVDAWPAVVAGRHTPYDHMRVWDEDDEPGGATTLRFDADELGVPHLGYIVENELLRHALLGALADTDAIVRFDSAVAAIRPRGSGFDIDVEQGADLNADLLIGADGARSQVREAAGIDDGRYEYAQTAFVTHARPEQPHAATAWQRFLRDGPIGLLPLSDGRVSIVWTTTPEVARLAGDANDDELADMLSDASGDVLGELRPEGPRGSYPLVARHAERYVDQGIALIGDAAHSIHPLAGQGANLGFADAAALVDTLVGARERGEHVGDRPVLRRYERSRRGENSLMLHFMTGLNRLFASDSVLLGELRKAGMALFNLSGPIRRRVASAAMGQNRQ